MFKPRISQLGPKRRLTPFAPLAILALLIATSSSLLVSGEGTNSAQVSTAPYAAWNDVGPRAISSPTFSFRGASSTAGKVFAVAYSQNSSTMYIGASGGDPYSQAGIYRSDDNGSSWVQVDGNITNRDVNALWMSDSNTDIVLAGTNEGLFRTTDGGSSWTLVYGTGVHAIIQAQNTVYAATQDGVLESSDFGASWSSGTLVGLGVGVLAYGPGVVYAQGSGELAVRNLSDGQWQTTRLSLPPNLSFTSMAVNSSDPLTVFATFCCAEGLQVTHDGGATWENLTLPQQYNNGFEYDSVTTVPANPAVVYVSGNGLFFESTDGGSTFVETTQPFDLWRVVPDLVSPGKLLGLSDQGLLMISPGGASWASLNGNLTTSILYSLSVNSGTIFTSVQDFSPIASFDGGTSWVSQWAGYLDCASSSCAPQGEGGTVAIDPYNSSAIYLMAGCCGLQYSTDGGHAFSQVGTAEKFKINDNGTLYNYNGANDYIAFDPNNPAEVYVAGEHGILKGSDYGASWSKMQWPFPVPTLIAIDPEDNNTIFVGNKTSTAAFSAWDQTGDLFVTHDGGNTWTKCNLDGASGYPSTIAIDPLNSSIVIVGVSSGPQSSGGILLSTDGGKNFTFANEGVNSQPQYLDGTSPPSMWDLSFQPNSTLVALATENGSYISTNLGQSWEDITGNAVSYAFTGLSWWGNTLYASTMGEGVLSTYVPADPIYGLTFRTIGLPAGLLWSVSIGGIEFASTGASLTVFVGRGDYPFSVAPPAGYSVLNGIGSLSVMGAVNTTIGFTSAASTTTSTKTSSSTTGSTTSSATTSTQTPPTSSSSASTSTSHTTTPAGTISSTSGNGGIPEFPSQWVAVALFTSVVVFAYLLSRFIPTFRRVLQRRLSGAG
ncbi:MAG: hypothetical protein JRN17_03305 [Nitrososphaerota archaeon]|nr:hypothetical protein [Nitrososphaerota archaeon]